MDTLHIAHCTSDNTLRTQFQIHDKGRWHDLDRTYYDSLVIILTTLESCLSNQSKETARFEEAQNVKLLLREICQYMSKDGPIAGRASCC